MEKTGKIVGKVFLLIITFFSFIVYADIRLDIRSAEGTATDVAVVGQPFLVEVTINGVQGSVQQPTLDGLDQFAVHRTGMYMSSINGVSTTKFTYQVRIDKVGDYIVGPARLLHQQKDFISNTLPIRIVHDVSAQFQHKNSNKTNASNPPVFLRLMVDADHVVVGQKINTVLRFYYQDSSLSLSAIRQPEIVGFDGEQCGKPYSGTADINGSRYYYVEWKWCLYPHQIGELVIPAYSVDYDLPLPNNRFMGGLFMVMSMNSNRKNIYSNAVKITVDPLPYSVVPVNAVGTFERITAEIAPPVAKEGEGMVLALEIVGDGNFAAIAAPKLSLPQELKYYDSSSMVIGSSLDGAQKSKKRFEFIVQGMKAGDWEIPEQSFLYFDTEQNKYVLLHSSRLSVSIQPVVTNTSKPSVLFTQKEEGNSGDIIDQKDILAPINTTGPWCLDAQEFFISWSFFIALLLITLLVVFFLFAFNNPLSFGLFSVRAMRKKVFKNAKKQLRYYRSIGDDTHIYLVIMNLFSELCSDRSDVLSRVVIEDYLIKHSFSDNQVEQWRLFFDRVSHAGYARSDSSSVDELCRMAIEWIDFLEKAV